MAEYVIDIEAGEDLDFDAAIISSLPAFWKWCVTEETYEVVPVAEYKGFRVGDSVKYYNNPDDHVSPHEPQTIECFVYVPTGTRFSVSKETEIYVAFKGMGFSPIENIRYDI